MPHPRGGGSLGSVDRGVRVRWDSEASFLCHQDRASLMDRLTVVDRGKRTGMVDLRSRGGDKLMWQLGRETKK